MSWTWSFIGLPTDTWSRFHCSLTATIIGRYWYLEQAVLNGTEYRYFAYGMHYRMDTPPKYSYVCNSASFIAHNKTTKYGTYNFDDKFFLTDLQVNLPLEERKRDDRFSIAVPTFQRGWNAVRTSELLQLIFHKWNLDGHHVESTVFSNSTLWHLSSDGDQIQRSFRRSQRQTIVDQSARVDSHRFLRLSARVTL